MNISLLLRERRNKYLIFGLLGLLVLVLLIPADTFDEKKTKTEVTYSNENDLELSLERVLSAMEGVGRAEVMITTEKAENNLFGDSSERGSVSGVVIVAEGADNAVVRTKISEAVMALFPIDAHKISIIKMRSQEEDR